MTTGGVVAANFGSLPNLDMRDMKTAQYMYQPWNSSRETVNAANSVSALQGIAHATYAVSVRCPRCQQRFLVLQRLIHSLPGSCLPWQE